MKQKETKNYGVRIRIMNEISKESSLVNSLKLLIVYCKVLDEFEGTAEDIRQLWLECITELAKGKKK